MSQVTLKRRILLSDVGRNLEYTYEIPFDPCLQNSLDNPTWSKYTAKISL